MTNNAWFRLAAWLSVIVAAARSADAQTLLQRLEPRVRQAAAFLVERPTLGARVGPVTEEARREHGLSTKRGALVAEVIPGGALDKAGIASGTAIVAVDGRRIDSPQNLSELVRGLRVGQEIELTYYDAEQLRRKRIRVESAEGPPTTDEAEPLPPTRGVVAPERPGEGRTGSVRPAPEKRLLDRLVGERPAAGAPPAERGTALNRLERAIEGLTRPAEAAPDGVEASSPPNTKDADVLAEIAELRAELVIVRRRLAELERRLNLGKPLPTKPDLDDLNDDRPRLDEGDPPLSDAEPKLQLGQPKLEAPANNAVPAKPVPKPPKPAIDLPEDN